jgi:hypothetical protein
MSKVDRAIHGPGWGEVILGAILSLALGVVLGAVLLVLKPVKVEKAEPKEREPGAVYYVEGARDASAGRTVLSKRKAFVSGQSVKLTEQEINALADAMSAPPPAAPAKPGEKAAAPAAPASSGMLSAGTPTVRIHDGKFQVGVPANFDVFGFTAKIIAQARGTFQKNGDVFVYEPTEMYFGSCPVDRLPFVSGYVRNKLIAAHSVPDDVAAAWSKVTNVAIEGNTLNLTMQ